MALPVVTETHTPPQVSDEALVDRLRGGQADAGEILVARYCRPLARYLQRLVGNDELAEELLQQTWLSVLDHIDGFDSTGGGGFKAWVYRIATNKANDHWRSRTRETSAREAMKATVTQDGPDASFRLDNAEQTGKLRQAIQQLPENQKQVLLMRYYSGMKFVDIAQALGCPLNTALGRMHKAMEKLKSLMQQ